MYRNVKKLDVKNRNLNRELSKKTIDIDSIYIKGNCILIIFDLANLKKSVQTLCLDAFHILKKSITQSLHHCKDIHLGLC